MVIYVWLICKADLYSVEVAEGIRDIEGTVVGGLLLLLFRRRSRSSLRVRGMRGRGDSRAGILWWDLLDLNLGRRLRVWGLGRYRLINTGHLLVLWWLLWNRRVECCGGRMGLERE